MRPMFLVAAAVAAGAIVYGVWLAPDDSPLFSVDAPQDGEPALVEPERDAGNEAKRPRRTRAGRRDERRERPHRIVTEAPASPDGPTLVTEPGGDQYSDSLARLLGRLRAGR